MVNRVLLNANALRVSKAGVDVLSAGLGSLQFNSDWSALGLLTTGTVSDSWSAIGSYAGTSVTTVNFGRTFATPPLVFFEIDAGGGAFIPIGDAAGFSFHLQENSIPSTPRYFYIVAQVTTTGIDFKARYDKVNGSWTTPHFTVRYTVMYYNL